MLHSGCMFLNLHFSRQIKELEDELGEKAFYPKQLQH